MPDALDLARRLASPDPVVPRLAMFGTWLLVWGLLVWAAAARLGAGGWSLTHAAMLAGLAIALPWTLLCCINGLAGFAILKLARDPAGFACPPLRAADPHAAPRGHTAIAITIRNEDADRVFRRADAMLDSLRETGFLAAFTLHILSDSDRPDIIAAEQSGFAALCRRHPEAGLLQYRRRPRNDGFKAGNLRDFALHAAPRPDFLLPLDADSLMSGAAMVRLVQVMQASPGLGILQTLVVGRPARDGFARIFQFGMRHGMRTHATGLAWYQGPAGPYWGHNALLRVAPFLAYCDIPPILGPPFAGPVLSHDQVEAARMRAAGWEVRVLPDEFESWEENPPSLPDFIRRDQRWCQGNLQYLRLVAAPGFAAMGRFQLANAVAMYGGAPGSALLLLAGLADTWLKGGAGALAFAWYLGTILLGFLPRLLGVAGALADRAERPRYGGGWRLLAGLGFDATFNLLVWPVVMVSQIRFIAGLLAGRRLGWETQAREGKAVPWRQAWRFFRPHWLVGMAMLALLLAARNDAALAWGAPVCLALLAAAPVAWLTASPGFGGWMRRHRLCAVPDEVAPAAILHRLEEGHDPTT